MKVDITSTLCFMFAHVIPPSLLAAQASLCCDLPYLTVAMLPRQLPTDNNRSTTFFTTTTTNTTPTLSCTYNIFIDKDRLRR